MCLQCRQLNNSGNCHRELLLHTYIIIVILNEKLIKGVEYGEGACNREPLSARIYIATSATENNTSVRSVNSGHFDLNFDISFDNGSVEDMFD